MEGYIKRGRTRDGREAADKTVEKWRTTLNTLREFFGYANLTDVTPGTAMEYRVWLESEKGYKPNTFRKHIQNCKLFFNGAMRDGEVVSNPFRDIPSGSVKNRERDYYLSPGDAEKIIAAAPDSMWKLIIALCRYGGLRCPSEVVSLTWSDILWDHNRIHVRSSKTEHHEGKESRVIPMFPELKPHLERAWDEAPEGATQIVHRKHRGSNLRTTLEKIILRAGLTPWPKLFHNMRASRTTELLTQGYPRHVVSAWSGNSIPVQEKHYAQVTDEHFDQATAVTPVTKTVTQPSDNVSQLQTELRKIQEKLRDLGFQEDVKHPE